MCDLSKSLKVDMLERLRRSGFMPQHTTEAMHEQNVSFFSPVVLHGNNLLVFGGTGIPFGESNGNDVHVCNVKYKRWALLSCRGKRPSRIYGQVPIRGKFMVAALALSFVLWQQCGNTVLLWCLVEIEPDGASYFSGTKVRFPCCRHHSLLCVGCVVCVQAGGQPQHCS